jgi:beta-1,4-N-acetylglucosaminyltransferase
VESLVLIAKANPNAIISAGPGIAVPISLIGKVFGKKVIFIEDWSRVYHKSSAGRIVYRFADLFFIQWPELNKVYPKGIFAGRLS